MTLSNGDLTVTSAAGASFRSIRSTVSKSSGKWYWEVTPLVDAVNRTPIGMGTSAMSLASFVGAAASSWSYYNNAGGAGRKINAGSLTAYGLTYVAGDVIGVYMDCDAGTLGFTKNGADQGQAFSNLAGTIFAACSVFDDLQSFTANFGATAFAGAPPSGYNSGLYS